MSIDELLIKYAEQFNKPFPMFVAPDDENKIIEIIKECIKTNKAYRPKYDKNVLY